MARIQIRLCDRCKKEIKVIDESFQDLIDNDIDLINEDICPNCYIDICLVERGAAQDLIESNPPGTSLKRLLEIYESLEADASPSP